VAAASLRGRPIAPLARGKRRLKRLIKQTPLLWRVFSAARALAGPLRGRRGAGAPDGS
jgi:CelD/BcsL family acetyltransferase involved in cellulose biosynthesis